LDFLREIERALDRIQQNPKQGTIYKNTGHRRLVVRRFPCNIFFIELPDRIRVTAIAHAKRRPGYWRKRAADAD
jgi:plasmid stabilization system protein ParE